MNVKDKIVDAVKILDDLESYNNSLSDSLSHVDSKICDLMHLIENNKLKTSQCYRVIKELRKIRLERRKIKNDMELLSKFNADKNKLLNTDYRKLLLNTIGITEKRLNGKYTNRIYTQEEIKELIGE